MGNFQSHEENVNVNDDNNNNNEREDQREEQEEEQEDQRCIISLADVHPDYHGKLHEICQKIGNTATFKVTHFTKDFEPTEQNTRQVFDILICFLPPELSLLVLDLAEYWPSITVKSFKRERIQNGQCRSVHLTRVPGKIRRVCIFSICHDQGWSTSEGSWTWGEAHFKFKPCGLEESQPLVKEFYRNIPANEKWQIHEGVYDASLLDRPLESISVIHGAVFPGWINHILCTFLKIEYALS